MNWPLRMLLVDIPKSKADWVLEKLRRDGYDVNYARVNSRAALFATLTQPDIWDLMVIDDVSQASAFVTLNVLLASGQELPCLVTTSQIERAGRAK
jgi:hypothetical protein